MQPRLRVRKRPQDPRDIGQNFPHEPRVPAFQRLGQNGVVGVIERLFGDLHRAHVRNALFYQHADEFGNGEHGMRIVELYGAILRKGRKVAVQPFVLFYDIADGRGGKKVFLADAQKFSLLGIVRGIENAADLFRAFAPLRLIEAKYVHALARDRHIVRHRLDVHIRKMHDLPLMFAAHAPRIAEALQSSGISIWKPFSNFWRKSPNL